VGGSGSTNADDDDETEDVTSAVVNEGEGLLRVNGRTLVGKAFELKAVTSPGGTVTGIRAKRTDMDESVSGGLNDGLIANEEEEEEGIEEEEEEEEEEGK